MTKSNEKMKFSKIVGFSLMLLYVSDAYKLPPHSPEWYSKIQEFLESPEPEEDLEIPFLPRDQVTFFLFTKTYRQTPINLTEETLNQIDENAERLFILIHGWLESREILWYEELKNALLDRFPNSNVIQVDYSGPAFDFYRNSAAAAKHVGQIVGDMLIDIHNKRNISTKNMVIMPHSLGSHVAGFAGKTVRSVLPRVARIIAMDPAGPRWDNKTCDYRLCKTDADVVEAIHTDAGGLGFASTIGTIDFYPNGGYKQNGCEDYTGKESVEDACDHSRSWAYFIEAIRHPTYFVSKKCSDWKTYEERPGDCDQVTLALGDLDNKVEGVFFFNTHEKSPFAMEDEEEKSKSTAPSMWRSDGRLLVIPALLLYSYSKTYPLLLNNLFFSR